MYVGLRDLKWARGRFALIGSVIVLITVLVGLLTGLTKGLGDQSTSAITGLHAQSLVFGGASFESSRVPTDLVRRGAPLGIATVRGQGPAGGGAVTLMGVRPGSAVAPDAAGVRPGTVVLSTGARDLVGDSISLNGHRLTVVATRGDASYSHVPVVWASLADWQRLTGSPDRATVIALSGKAPHLPATYDVRTIPQSLSAIGSYSSEHGSLLLIRGFLLAISALVVGAFFTVWTIQRSGDIAVLKALGSSTWTLLRDALGQAAVVLAIGSLVGAGIAVGAGLFASSVVPFSLDPATLALPVGLLAGLGLAGAALAVRRVTSVDPLTALGSAR
ncbi:MAG: ABC transporter permease [Marmoricola sp.]